MRKLDPMNTANSNTVEVATAPDVSASAPRGVTERLKQAGLRPTRQRIALGSLLFDGVDRHVTAEQLHGAVLERSIRVSLATVYNTLHQFTTVGLLREVVVEPGRSYFDTNVDEHHHFYVEGPGRLLDIPASHVTVTDLPAPPPGMSVSRIEVIIRVAPTRS